MNKDKVRATIAKLPCTCQAEVQALVEEVTGESLASPKLYSVGMTFKRRHELDTYMICDIGRLRGCLLIRVASGEGADLGVPYGGTPVTVGNLRAITEDELLKLMHENRWAWVIP